MTIEEMKQRKRELGLSYEAIADRSGVPLGTVQKIFTGVTKAPREETILALEELLKPTDYTHLMKKNTMPGMMAENTCLYRTAKQPGEYELSDYLSLPEDTRVELIDGRYYEMLAPTAIHQTVAAELYFQLRDFLRNHFGECMPFLSPIDVVLDEDQKTVVQPDVIILCDPAKIKEGRIYGAPDLVAEVISPSTRKKDTSLKQYKYCYAGVREYWTVYPQERKIVVYGIEEEEIPRIYNAREPVPVGIWGGKCSVNFQDIFDMYDRFVRSNA